MRQHTIILLVAVGIAFCQPTWAQNPDTPPVAADAARAKRHPAQAAVLYEQYLADFPKSHHCVQARLDLAECYLASGQPGRAIATLHVLPADLRADDYLYTRWIRLAAQAYMANGDDTKAAALREAAYAMAGQEQFAFFAREMFEDYYLGKLGSAPGYAVREIDALLARNVLIPADTGRLRYLRLKCLSQCDPRRFLSDGVEALAKVGAGSTEAEVQKAVGLCSTLYPQMLSARRYDEAGRTYALLDAALTARKADDAARAHRTAYLDALAAALPRALPDKPSGDVASMLDAYWAVWKAYPGAAALHAGALLAGRWRDDPRAEAWWPRFNALVDSLTPADPARVPSLWARAQVGYHRSLQAGLTDDAAGGLRAQALRDAEATFTGGGATAAGLEAASWLMGQYRAMGRQADTDAVLTQVTRLPATPATLVWLGEYWMAADGPEGAKTARTYWEALLKQMPADRDAPLFLYRLGLCQQRLGRRDDARKSFARVVADYENSPVAQVAARQVARMVEDGR